MSYYGKYDLRISLIKGVIKKHFHQGESLCARTQREQLLLLNNIKDTLKTRVNIKIEEIGGRKKRPKSHQRGKN